MRNYRTGLLPQVRRRGIVAASRILSSPINAVANLCVSVTAVCTEFPLAQGLFSTNSAGGWPAFQVEHLCSLASPILRPSPTSQKRACRTYGYCLLRPDRRNTRAATFGISRFPSMELACMPWFFDSAGPKRHSRFTQRFVLSSPSGNKVDNPSAVISELSSPAYTPPVNASPPPSREADA